MSYYTLIKKLFNDDDFAFAYQRGQKYNTGESLICPKCGSVLSLLPWMPPHEVTVSKKEIGDFLFGTYPGFIVSKNIKDKYLRSSLTGLNDFRKVEIFYKNQKIDIEYYYPNIPIITAFVDEKYIDYTGEISCNTCQKNGRIINAIDGIDFLKPESISVDVFFTTAIGQGVILFSEKFNKFIINHQFTNIDLINVLNYKWDSMNPL